MGFYDIETTNLTATFGYVLSYCIKERGGPVISRCITPKEIRSGTYDKRLCQQFIKDLERFDRIVGFYSARFDGPYMRTRCLYHGLDFPPWGSFFHTDLWFQIRGKLRLHSNRLQAACDFFGIESKGHRLNPTVWHAAMAGDPEALDYILKHNIEDVESTEKLWDKMNGQFRVTKTSL